MNTKVSFIDQKRIKVETKDGDCIVLGFMNTMNYQIEEQFDGFASKKIAIIFDKFYDGNDDSLWGPIMREFINARLSPFLWAGLDRDRERARIGNRIRELRKAQDMEAKELAKKVGIDAGNLSRIEQGRFSVGFDILSKIACALNMSVDFVPIKNMNNERDTKLCA